MNMPCLARKATSVAVCLFSLLCLPGPWAAAAAWQEYFPPLESVRGQSPDPAREFRVGAPLPEELRFRLYLPDPDWQRRADPDPAWGGRHLISYAAPAGPAQGLIQVYSFEPPHEVNQADWFLHLMQEERVKVLAQRSAAGAAGALYEVLGSIRQAGERPGDLLLRAAVLRSGKRFYLVKCLAEAPAFRRLAEAFAVSLARFRPDEARPPALVGDWRRFCLEGIYCYQGPVTRKLAQGAAKGGGREVRHQLPTETYAPGILHVSLLEEGALDKQRPEEVIARLAKDLGRDLRVSWQGGAFRAYHAGLEGEVVYYQGQGAVQEGDVELLAMASADTRRPVLAWLVTVGPLSRPETWMRNKRAFEVACRSLQEVSQ